MQTAWWSIELLVVVALATWRYVRTMDEMTRPDVAADRTGARS